MRNEYGKWVGTVWLGLALAACGGGGDDETGTRDAPDSVDVLPDDGADLPPPDSAEDAAADEPDASPDDGLTDVDDATDGTDAPPVVGECRNDSPEGLMGCVQTARLTADLEAIVGDRSPGSGQWQIAQDLCASTFTALGYTVESRMTGCGRSGTPPWSCGG